jgi:ABC-type transporter Mla subunit MlaD
MNKDRNALKAGTFIVVSAVVVGGIVAAVKDWGRFSEPAQVRSVKFKLTDDIGGLRVGDELRVGGFKVGSVKAIEPAGMNGIEEASLLVTFTVPRKYVLREGTTVGVQSGLTGSTVLNIQDMGRGKPLADDAVLAGIGDPKGRLFANLGDVKIAETVEAFKKTATTATDTIAQVKTKIDPAFDKYAGIADPAAQAVTKVRDLIDEGKGDVKGTLANLNAASGTVKQKVPEVMDRVNSTLAKVEKSVDKLQTSLDDVKVALANAKDLTGSAKGVLVGNRSRLDAIFASVKTTGDNLKAASAEIRRSPWRLLYKPAKGEMANLNLYDAARQFAEGANDMNDTATALRDALAAKELDEKQLRHFMERLDKSFVSFQQVEKTLWERVKE